MPGLGDVTPVVRTALRATRDARRAADDLRPIVVEGPRADEVAAALREGGEPGAVVVGSTSAGAAAYVLLVAGEPSAEDVADLRRAARARVPGIAVRLDGSDGPVPYVLATDVVRWPPGEPLPLEALVRAVVRDAGTVLGVALGLRLPVVRAEVERELLRNAAVKNAGLGAAPWIKGPHMLAMGLVQGRLLLDLAAVAGKPIEPAERREEIGAVVAAGLGARALGRRLARRLPPPLVGAATGAGVTLVLGVLGRRRHRSAP